MDVMLLIKIDNSYGKKQRIGNDIYWKSVNDRRKNLVRKYVAASLWRIV